MVSRAPLSVRPAGLHDGFGWCPVHAEAWHPGVRRACPKCASLPSMPTRAGAVASKPKRPRSGLAVENAMRDALVAAGYVEDLDFVRESGWAVEEGRAYRADFRFLGVPLLLECEGGAHAIKRQHLDDCQRASLAAALGYRVLRVHAAMIASGEAVALVRRALAFNKAAHAAAKESS